MGEPIVVGRYAALPDMAFKVYRNNATDDFEEYGDEESFEVSSGGVLKITRRHGTNRYITPGLWASIDETPAPSVYASPIVARRGRRHHGPALLVLCGAAGRHHPPALWVSPDTALWRRSGGGTSMSVFVPTRRP